jgi:uncharacterized protein (TIGR03067 family)
MLVLEREPAPAPKTDEEKLQGDWQITNGRFGGEEQPEGELLKLLQWLGQDIVTFDGNTVTFPPGLGVYKPLPFELDSTAQPRRLAMRLGGVVVKSKGLRNEIELRGVYALDGDDLKLCYGMELNGTEFPKDFEPRPASGSILLHLKRRKTAAAPAEAADARQGKATSRVGQIIVEGNQKIPTAAIVRHLNLWPGKAFDGEDLRRAEQKLAECPMFVVDEARAIRPTVMAVPTETLHGGLASGLGDFKDIRVTVKEK